MIVGLEIQRHFLGSLTLQETAGRVSQQYFVILDLTTSLGNTETGEVGLSWLF